MAVIQKCAKCRLLLRDALPCPGCGETKRLFYADYFPDGRKGSRRRVPIPDAITDIESARLYEKTLRAASLEARKPGADVKNLSGSTIEDLTPDYLSWVKLHRTAGTLREREYSMEYINRIVGNIPVAAFNTHHFSLYQTTRKAQGVSNKTVNKELYYVMGFLKWAKEEMGIDVRNVTMKKLPYHRPLPIVLSPGEVSKIIDASPPFYKALFSLLYSLGLRFSEAAKLKWSDIDFANKAILCVQKGGAYKLLPMPAAVEGCLKAIRVKGGPEYVFYSPRARGPVVNVRKALKTACRKAGIEKSVYPHLFRHSAATAMMSAGINLRTIQGMLGHADIGTTEFYTHVAMEHLRAAGKVLTLRSKSR